MITEETISRVKSSLQATKSFLALEVIEQLEKENAELKEKLEVFEDMKADMCTTDNTVLFNYLRKILMKYEVIV